MTKNQIKLRRLLRKNGLAIGLTGVAILHEVKDMPDWKVKEMLEDLV